MEASLGNLRGVIGAVEVVEARTSLRASKASRRVKTKIKVRVVRVRTDPGGLATPPTHQNPAAAAIIATGPTPGSVWRR